MVPWRLIMKVREDHGTIYVRIPRSWAKENGVTRGSYVVVHGTSTGELSIKTFEDEVNNGKRTEDGERGGDQR